MNKKILLIIITVSLLLAGCGKSVPTNTVPQDRESSSVVTTKTADAKSQVVTTPTATTTSSESKSDKSKDQTQSTNNSILGAYKAVLQNKAEFYSTDTKKNVYLNNFLTNKEIYETVFKITHFTVLDMDGDKIPEVVLELSVDKNGPMCFEVLHYMNGEVYGYNIVYRGLEQLKADGSFRYSGGAADYGSGKLKFESNAYKVDSLGYCKSKQYDTDPPESFFIDNKPVTEEKFNSFIKAQDGKKDVVWYEFSEKNIEKLLSVIP